MRIKNRQQMLVVVAAAVVVLFALDGLVRAPLVASWKARATRLANLRKKVEDGRLLITREEGLRSRWDQMRRNTLPDNPSLAEQQMLKAFDRWSQSSGVSILSLSPQQKHEADEYMTLECRVEAAGSLSALTRFLYDLERDPMALKVQMVELSSRDTEGQQLALGLQVSGLILPAQENK